MKIDQSDLIADLRWQKTKLVNSIKYSSTEIIESEQKNWTKWKFSEIFGSVSHIPAYMKW